MRRPREDEPERRSLEALIPARRAGLSRVVTIPCRGEHTRMVERSALLVSDGTRDDPERYAAALRAFR